MSASYVSQMIRGKKPVTPERAILIARFLGLDPVETRSLVLLAEMESAGNPVLRDHFARELSELRKGAQAPGEKFQQPLSAGQEAQYYSHWYYSATLLALSIPTLQTPGKLAARLGLSLDLVERVLEFLTEAGLCRREGGRYLIQARYSMLGKSSSMIDRHLLNWRAIAMEHLPVSRENDLFFSLPMVTDRETAHEIRGALISAIQGIRDRLEQSESRSLFCLNMDWLEVRPSK